MKTQYKKGFSYTENEMEQKLNNFDNSYFFFLLKMVKIFFIVFMIFALFLYLLFIFNIIKL